MSFPDSILAWQAAVDNNLITGDPTYYSDPRATQEEINHALIVAILEAHGIDWRNSGDPTEPPVEPPTGGVPFGSRPQALGTIRPATGTVVQNLHFNGRANDDFIYRSNKGHNSHVCILTNGRDITIKDCDFEDVSQPVAVIGGGSVTIENCRGKGIVGPGSRVDEQTGNFVQTVNSPDNVHVLNNKVIVYTDYDPWGGQYERFTEDVISFFSASDSSAVGNRIDATGYVRDSGTGIIAGDSHGARVRIENNWLLNPGQVGIAIAGDPGHRVLNNRIWKDADQNPGSGNTAAYCWDYNGGTPTDDVLFQGNRAKWNGGGGLWNPGPPPATTVDNNWDDDSLNRDDFVFTL